MAIRAFSQLNKRQQMAVLVGAPCVVLIALGWYTNKKLGELGPDPQVPGFLQRAQPDNLWGQIEQKKSDIADKQKIIDEGPGVEAQLAAMQDDIKEAERRLPSEAEKSEMRQLIEKLARDIAPEVGTVRLISVRIAEGAKATGRGTDYQPITYQIEIEGDLNGIIKYVDQIEKNPRFMSVTSFTLKPGDMKLTEAKDKIAFRPHAVAMDVVTYVYTPQKGRGR